MHAWRPRRSRFGELVQWDTSEHDWLEGRGEKLYLIVMIDDATSRLFARFVRHDSTAENMKLLQSYLEKFGRPIAFYTDKAALFQTAEKRKRDEPGVEKDAVEMPPTQIGRGLRELGIAWIAAHSPQAKGRVERNFKTAQDRLVKGLRVAGVKTIEEANGYLEEEFLPWWNETLMVEPANSADAHRPWAGHDLRSALSHVETRQVTSDYTIRWGKVACIRSTEAVFSPAFVVLRCAWSCVWTERWRCVFAMCGSRSASASRARRQLRQQRRSGHRKRATQPRRKRRHSVPQLGGPAITTCSIRPNPAL